MTDRTVLAVDLGAESGRVMAVHFDGATLRQEEIHRFANSPVRLRDTIHWNILDLWSEIEHGLEAGRGQFDVASVGVDTWGVDFGLLDASGALLGNPVHYRDGRTEGMMEWVFERISPRTIFTATGIQFMPINTLYQLASLVRADSPQLTVAHTFLTIPDLINYWLSGARVCEYTNATTTQLLDPGSGQWAEAILDAVGIPTRILPEIVDPGTKLGTWQEIPVIAPATHDTGSAVAAVPASEADYVYISSGTWSLVGVEVDRPNRSERAREINVTNEGGVEGTIRLLKNLHGLWILQQARESWVAAGQDFDYATLVEMAAEVEGVVPLFDPDDPVFLAPGDHPGHIAELCRRTDQPAPEDPATVTRSILESLALKYRYTIDELSELTGSPPGVVHIVGGGSRNALLCQLTANACGLPVLAGPAEGTVLGNALVQLQSLGEIGSIAEGRQLVAESVEMERYAPEEQGYWSERYDHFRRLLESI